MKKNLENIRIQRTGESFSQMAVDAIILTGSKHPEYVQWREFLSTKPVIIAADSGLEQLLDTGVMPDYIVGDFDSLENCEEKLAAYPQAVVQRHPRAKDESDTELALMLARDLGCKRPLLLGAGEGRLDHLLAVVQLATTDLAPYAWLTACELIVSITPSRALHYQADADSLISFYPLVKPSTPIITKGLTWPFSHFDGLYSGMSLSNTLKDSFVEVSIEDGLLLAIIPLKQALSLN